MSGLTRTLERSERFHVMRVGEEVQEVQPQVDEATRAWLEDATRVI